MPVADKIRAAMELSGVKAPPSMTRIPKGALSPRRDVLATDMAVAAVVARSWLDDVRQFLRMVYKNPVFGMLAACAMCLVRCRPVAPLASSLFDNSICHGRPLPPSLLLP